MAKKTKSLLITTIVFVVLCVISQAYFGWSFIDVKLSTDNWAGLAFIVLLPLWFIVSGALTVGAIILTAFLTKKMVKLGLILLAVTIVAGIIGVLCLFVFGKPLNTGSVAMLAQSLLF